MPRPKKNPEAPVIEGEQDAPASGRASAPVFVFIGDKNGHGPDQVEFRGLIFVKNGQAVEVKDRAAAAKLAANNHFKAV